MFRKKINKKLFFSSQSFSSKRKKTTKRRSKKKFCDKKSGLASKKIFTYIFIAYENSFTDKTPKVAKKIFQI